MTAIVIPNRTKRWFHEWTSEVKLNAGSSALFPMVGDTYQFPSELYGGRSFTLRDDMGYYMGQQRTDLTGLQDQIGVSIPITSGNYMGLPRDGSLR